MERAHDQRARGGDAPDTGDVDAAVDRFLSGDEETVVELLGTIRAAVASRGFYVPVDDRPGIVSETMLQLFQHLSDARREQPRRLVAFARTLAYRRCVDWMRRHVPSDELAEGLPGDASPERDVLADERVRLGRQALAEISENCRELIRRHSGGGESFREIAERDGRLEKTVRNQLYKCLDRARAALRRIQRRDRLALFPPRGAR